MKPNLKRIIKSINKLVKAQNRLLFEKWFTKYIIKNEWVNIINYFFVRWYFEIKFRVIGKLE